MHIRRILFPSSELSKPQIYRAMRADGIDGWIDHGNGIAEASDNWANDFPNLRHEVQKSKESYEFHVLETLDGSCLTHMHCRHGFVTRSEKLIDNKDIESLKEAIQPKRAAV